MNKKHPSVSIVIPAYNEGHRLRVCLEAIGRQTVTPDEVIIVDNNSTDNTAEVAQQFDFARVITESRQGIVFARNAGFDAAHGDIIGRIDADIVLPETWVEHIVDFYDLSNRKNWAWTGAGSFYNVQLAWLVNFAYSLLAFRLNWLLIGHYTLWGSNMALPKELWIAVRSKVHQRTDIHEDLDLAIHLKEAGFRIHYDTTIKTSACLRRVNSNRDQLWGYLQWWPRTLRLHHKWSWPVCWFFGAFLLYGATYILVLANKLTRSGDKP